MKFCKNCGNQLEDGATFCGKCGTAQDEVTQTVTSNPVPNPSSQESSQEANFLTMRVLGKVLVLLALVCFFFTFMSVSCAGETEKISGTDMIFGDSSVTDTLEDEGYDSDSSLFNIFVCLSGVSGILAIFTKKSSACFAGLSAILLLIFRFSAKHYYKIGDASLKEWEDMNLETHFGFALYLAIVLFFLATLLLESAREEKKKQSNLPNSNAPPVNSATVTNASVPSESTGKTS